MRKLAHHHEYSINIERARKLNYIRKQKNPEQHKQHSAIKVNAPNKLRRYTLLARVIRDS
jgi:hypothetical protein